MNIRTEDEIRDYLAQNLDCIERGTVLINREEYLPNDKGASGWRSQAGPSGRSVSGVA